MYRNHNTPNNKSVSPVIGVILMVAITVILAAVIGTFVLGLGSDINVSPQAGISTTQEPGFIQVSLTSSGNIDDMRIAGPSGSKSMRFDEAADVGTRIIIADNVSSHIDIQETNSGTNLVGGEQCVMRHGEETIHGVEVNGADIGCSGSELTSLGADVDGSEIEYSTDAEYQVIGIVEANEGVITTFRTGAF